MISENLKIVPVMKYSDISSTVYTDSINMRGFHKCSFVFMFNTLGGASAALTITSGVTESAYTSALYFNYALGGAAIGIAVAASTASCDVLGAWTNAATLTLTHGTYTNKMLIVEVNAAAMDMENDEEWLSGVITTAGSVTGYASCIAILEPRYSSNRSPTCLK